MAAQKGLDMLIKVSSDGTSGGTMNTIGGMRSTSIAFNAEMIEVTSADDAARWRQGLAGGAVRSVSISGSGIFKDDAAIEDLRDHIAGTAETLAYLQFVLPDWGTIAGAFHVSGLTLSGEHTDAKTFEGTFESAGDITWTAAV